MTAQLPEGATLVKCHMKPGRAGVIPEQLRMPATVKVATVLAACRAFSSWGPRL